MPELADAVVVGGGVLGLFMALELSRLSWRVIVLEEERFGSAATGKGFGWINSSSKLDDESYHRLNSASVQLYRRLATEFGEDRIGWRGGGSLYVGDEADSVGVVRLRKKMETLSHFKTPACLLNSSEISALEPNLSVSSSSIALFAPDEGWVESGRLVRFLMEQGKENGVVYRDFTKVTGFQTDRLGAASSVLTDTEAISTRHVILCAGIRNQSLMRLIANGKRSDASLRELPEMIREVPGLIAEVDNLPRQCQVERVIYPAVKNGFHLRPTPAGGIVFGADDTDLIRSADSVAELISRARRVLSSLPEGVSYTSRICIRPVPIDSFPAIGGLPSMPGFSLMASHSGMTLAPILAKMLAQEIMTGGIDEKLKRYAPGRFGGV